MQLTIGSYYPANSKIHSLDPRTKILLTFGFLVFVFISKSLYGNLISAIFLGITLFLSKVPFRLILKSLKVIIVLLLFTILLNLFLTREGKILFEFSFIRVTTTGVSYAFKTAFRFIILMIASSILTFTTKPIDLADGIEFLLSPLKKVKFPSHEIAMMITIALRFIPTIIEELDKISKAQMSRGVCLDTGNLISRIKGYIPILIPLFVSSFKRADDLALAMECRCYRGDINRTKLKQLRYAKNDYIAFALLFLYLCIIVCLRIFIY